MHLRGISAEGVKYGAALHIGVTCSEEESAVIVSYNQVLQPATYCAARNQLHVREMCYAAWRGQTKHYTEEAKQEQAETCVQKIGGPEYTESV